MQKDYPRHLIRYFGSNLAVVVGLVLVWRGTWYVLDFIDIYLLNDPTHALSAVGGIVLGFAILFLPDHDLKEIQKL